MRRLARWHGGLVAALVAASAGLYTGDYGFFLLATVPVAYVVYGQLTDLGPPSLDVGRTVDPERTDPGESVTVEVTVTNTGDRPIPDLRVVDAVPEQVAVVEGSPAACVALRPGESVTVTYEVLPPRGTHEFGAVTVRGRSVAGTVVGTTQLDADGTRTVVCDTLLEAFPLQDRTSRHAGLHPTDAGGEGTTFYAVREYRRGDPVRRIDWRRLARTGDLATVTYRQERTAAVVFVIDDRPTSDYQPPAGGPTTTDYAVYAAAQGFVTLTDVGHQVGVTTLATGGTEDWVDPGRGGTTEAAAADLFDRLHDVTPGDPSTAGQAGLAADGAGPADGTGTTEAADPVGAGPALSLVTRLPSHAQVVLCTPLVDDDPVDVVETLLSNGYPVTVLSPNVTFPADGHPTPGQATTDLARRNRLADLQRLGVPATDWSPDQPLQVAIADTVGAHERRWNR